MRLSSLEVLKSTFWKRDSLPHSLHVRPFLCSSVKYQPVECGEAYGYVCVEGMHTLDVPAHNCIMVFQKVPLDTEPIAALISSEIQTPLCHVALLCHAR